MALLALLLSPLDLNRLGPADALSIDGLPVLASVLVVNPPDTAFGVTVAGDDTRPDGVPRAVYLPGGADVSRGERVTVVGRLRVVFHPPGNGFRGFAEIRVEGWCRP